MGGPFNCKTLISGATVCLYSPPFANTCFPSFCSGYVTRVHSTVDLISLCFVVINLILSVKSKYIIIEIKLCGGQKIDINSCEQTVGAYH